jgi:LDH2 family malate/lactate/ureidoglycolate dehydrogenase
VAIARALDELEDRVTETGVALAGIRRSSHIGMLSPYLERTCDAGLIGLLFTTSEALVHPAGGATALIGTNPIGIGIPAEPSHFVLDMATSAISMGEVIAHQARGQELPEGRAIDSEGVPTTDPVRARSGALSPFGGAKGYGLALGLELLVATLSGTALGVDVTGTLDRDKPATKGDLIVVIEPARAPAMVAAASEYLEAIRSAPTAPDVDAVLVPGDRARAQRAESCRTGIEYPQGLWAQLRDLRVRYGVNSAS